MWFGTLGGVSRAVYPELMRRDGNQFSNLTVEDGLTSNEVWAIHAASDGTMWFGTVGGGVSRYDGVNWTSLDTRDGLAGNNVQAIQEDADGFLWIGTTEGITRYRPNLTRPGVRVASVKTDREYRDLQAIPPIQVGNRVTIEYSAIDFKTVPEKRQYRCRIREIDSEWGKPTKADSFDHIFDQPGIYTFEVQTIDRDLSCSEPATLSLTVQPDPSLVFLQTEVEHLRREVGMKYHFQDIIGRSPGIRQVRALMKRAIDSGLTVLIIGETGTGKELVAKAIHYNSSRKDYPLLARNCGAIPRELLASDLFGHRKGAFTGATDDKIGSFEAASGGTILLDEIGEMPKDAQVHLLRVLEEREVRRLGENTSRDVDVRIIAMSNRELLQEIMSNRFREDLYYRLSEFPIHIPPLRERVEDISLLAEHFLEDIDKPLDGFSPGVLEALKNYPWPGNVRELGNVIRRAAALAEEGKQLQTYHFPLQATQEESLIQEIVSKQTNLSASVERLQRRLIENALRECDGNRSQAARTLGIHQPNLVRLMKRLGIK